MSALEESRRKRGALFQALYESNEAVKTAWYEEENKPALIDEVVHTYREFIKQMQREIDTWEARR